MAIVRILPAVHFRRQLSCQRALRYFHFVASSRISSSLHTRNFCTIVHSFAQCFIHISIDAANEKAYFAFQIEPGSVRTLRLSFQGAASLNSSCAEKLNCEARGLGGFIERARHASRWVASTDGIGKAGNFIGSVWKARQASRRVASPGGIGEVNNFLGFLWKARQASRQVE